MEEVKKEFTDRDVQEGFDITLKKHKGQIQARLSALEKALKAGFEDSKMIQTDPDLAKTRTSEEFDPLLKKYDESFINENAINVFKSLFGFNK